MTEPTGNEPTPGLPALPPAITSVAAVPATKANPGTAAVHARFRELQKRMLQLQRREIVMTRDQLQNETREMATLLHTLQETSPTGPKKAPAEKGAAKPRAMKAAKAAARTDLTDLDI